MKARGNQQRRRGTIGVLIVDAHPIAREGIRWVLERDPAFRVLGEAANGEEAIRQAQRLRPEVVLMDLSLPHLDGSRAIASVRRELPTTLVVVLTDVLTPTSVTQAMQTGARGYLLKEARPSEIRAAIQDVVAGRVHLPARVSTQLATRIQRFGLREPLSLREQEVLQLLAEGCSTQEIKRILQISEATVKSHVRNIFSRLSVRSRAQAILVAMRLGLVSVSPDRTG